MRGMGFYLSIGGTPGASLRCSSVPTSIAAMWSYSRCRPTACLSDTKSRTGLTLRWTSFSFAAPTRANSSIAAAADHEVRGRSLRSRSRRSRDWLTVRTAIDSYDGVSSRRVLLQQCLLPRRRLASNCAPPRTKRCACSRRSRSTTSSTVSATTRPDPTTRSRSSLARAEAGQWESAAA